MSIINPVYLEIALVIDSNYKNRKEMVANLSKYPMSDLRDYLYTYFSNQYAYDMIEAIQLEKHFDSISLDS